MDLSWRPALAAVALVFLAFLVARLRPGSRRMTGALATEVQAARARARDAQTPDARADALIEAAERCAGQGRWTAAAGLALRGLRASPSQVRAVGRVVQAFGARPRMLEKMLWRRLSQLDPRGQERGAFEETLRGLSTVYRKLRDRRRQQALGRVLDGLGATKGPPA